MTDELTAQNKLDVLRQMMQNWEQAAYSGEINVRVADGLGDDAMKQRAVAQIERAEKALDVLREELGMLEGGGDGTGGKLG